MPRRPAAYPAAYREQIVALARSGLTLVPKRDSRRWS